MSNPTAAKPWEHAKAGEGSAADPLATRFVASLDYDRRLYKHDIRGSLAHARMLRHVDLISDDELKQIEQGLTDIEREITEQGDAWPGWDESLEDVHMCVEAALIAKVGDAGRKLHTGRSRNDQIALDLLLWVEEAADALTAKFNTLNSAFVTLAERDGRFVMPSYTHLQRAQPIVVGGELLAWASAFERCNRRLRALVNINRRNPLGSGAIAGSSLPLDREHTAAALNVGPPSDNSLDATASRDAAIDLAYALTMASNTLSRWAEQWILYCTTEFGFVTLDGRYTTGSSMMPQKQNPDMLELLRGRSGGITGQLVALLTMTKGITIGYNRDLQEDKRYLFAAYDSCCDCLDIAAGIVATAKFNEKAIAAGLNRGYLDATSLADYLVTKGVPFRTAHQVVGKLVQTCEAQGLGQLAKLSLEQFNDACGERTVVDQDVYQWLGAANVVKRYRSSGNGGLSGFEQQLKQWKQRLGQDDG
ncbi:argininosuccinate lyase [Phycisphaerales bacterium AB-hyl4]|uniref:Argininosuccinate lyase n=1 Tax=Natronomicrosphaera hydrolytica TaxID=3242702 RepID=A0ABV4U4U2_9BACT